MLSRAIIALHIGVLCSTLAACAQSDPVRAPFTPGEDLLLASEYPEIITHTPVPLRIPRDGLRVFQSDGAEPLRFTLQLRNIAEQPFYAVYRTDFFDSEGRKLNIGTLWREISFPPRGPNRISASANSLDAETFRVEISPR